MITVGGATCDRGADASNARALGAHLTIVNYDRRGRGDSGDTLPYADEREIEDLAALIEAAGGRTSLLRALLRRQPGAACRRRRTAGRPVRPARPAVLRRRRDIQTACGYAATITGLIAEGRRAEERSRPSTAQPGGRGDDRRRTPEPDVAGPSSPGPHHGLRLVRDGQHRDRRDPQEPGRSGRPTRAGSRRRREPRVQAPGQTGGSPSCFPTAGIE
jgi:hypothetical protein